MKPKHLLILAVFTLSVEFGYFLASDGPFMDYSVTVSEQLSAGNDDRLALQFGSMFFAIPVLYGLLTLPFDFRLKGQAFAALYILAFTIWAFYLAAVCADSSLVDSFLFGDW